MPKRPNSRVASTRLNRKSWSRISNSRPWARSLPRGTVGSRRVVNTSRTSGDKERTKAATVAGDDPTWWKSSSTIASPGVELQSVARLATASGVSWPSSSSRRSASRPAPGITRCTATATADQNLTGSASVGSQDSHTVRPVRCVTQEPTSAVLPAPGEPTTIVTGALDRSRRSTSSARATNANGGAGTRKRTGETNRRIGVCSGGDTARSVASPTDPASRLGKWSLESQHGLHDGPAPGGQARCPGADYLWITLDLLRRRLAEHRDPLRAGRPRLLSRVSGLGCAAPVVMACHVWERPHVGSAPLLEIAVRDRRGECLPGCAHGSERVADCLRRRGSDVAGRLNGVEVRGQGVERGLEI